MIKALTEIARAFKVLQILRLPLTNLIDRYYFGTAIYEPRFILLLFFPQLNTLFPDLPSINFYPAIDIVKRDFAFSTSDRMRRRILSDVEKAKSRFTMSIAG